MQKATGSDLTTGQIGPLGNPCLKTNSVIFFVLLFNMGLTFRFWLT